MLVNMKKYEKSDGTFDRELYERDRANYLEKHGKYITKESEWFRSENTICK